uniref:Peptidase M13 C-terminal domain-containing protein n=1 Tax=Meloidogyne enterolobii TaxID=390850 RepID=A0A6V7TV05_MELEN|nr:unnamed protein product [Meloidogyne enterolobii]
MDPKTLWAYNSVPVPRSENEQQITSKYSFYIIRNIADNAGIRASYRAWKLFTTTQRKFKNLENSLNKFTDEQMFFIGNAFVSKK